MMTTATPSHSWLDLTSGVRFGRTLYDGGMAREALKECPLIPWKTLKAEIDAELERDREMGAE